MSQITTFELEGLSCAACVGRAERVLKKVAGVEAAEVNLAAQTVRLQIADGSTVEAADTALRKAGYGLRQQVTQLGLQGMSCASCVARVEKLALAQTGVVSASANLAQNTLTLGHRAGPDILPHVLAALSKAGYEAEPLDGASPDRHAAEQAQTKHRFLVAAALTAPVFVLEMGGHLIPAFHHWVMGWLGQGPSWGLQAVLVTLVLLGPGRGFLTRGVPALLRGAPDMNSLVAVGTLAAWCYSMVALLVPTVLPEGARVVYFEAAAVIVTLILAGRWLEARARGRTGAAIARLVALQPDRAMVERPDGGAEERAASGLQVGDVLVVRPGERLAADGVVLSGQSYIDESMITGEPVPVLKVAGAEVTGGTLNGQAPLRVEVRSTGGDTRLAQILRMVSEAQASKLPIQAVVDRVTSVFVPVVLALALATVALWLAFGGGIAQAVVAGVSVLIVACPCAMGLATPTSIMVGTGRAAELGVLFRKGEALQRLAQIEAVAFDKTGTLTEGRPELVKIITPEDESRLLQLAAAVEAQSEHPVAAALMRAAERQGLAQLRAEEVQTLVGRGVKGVVEGQVVVIGNARLMSEEGVDLGPLLAEATCLAAEGASVLYIAEGTSAKGLIVVADQLKEGSAEAVASLQAAGLAVAMISGDAEPTARAVATKIGITQAVGGVLPEGKVEAVAGMGKVAFVGDGINDAPVLAAAEVGIAMGQGTDVAIEAADVVLSSGDPRTVVTAIQLARATLRNIHQNLFWAFAYNTALLPVAAGVLYPLWGITLSPVLAAGAMALSSVFVLGNALRLRKVGQPLGRPSH